MPRMWCRSRPAARLVGDHRRPTGGRPPRARPSTWQRQPAPGEMLVVRDDTAIERVFAAVVDATAWVFHDGDVFEVDCDADGAHDRRQHQGSLSAPMPATVVSVNVAAGRRVSPRDDPDRARSDENGAAGSRARATASSTAVHCKSRRSRCSPDVAADRDPMNLPAIASPSWRSARATGCRTSPPPIATADKIAFVDRLSAAGHRAIEVSAFVSPKWVPQMADAAEVFAGITRRPGTRYTALVPNLTGLARAHRGAGRRNRRVRRRLRDVQPPEHQSDHRRVAGDATAQVVRPGARSSACRCARMSRPRSAARSKARSRRTRSRDVAGALLEMGAYEVAVSDTIGDRPSRAGAATSSRRGRRTRAARSDRAAFPRHARHGARQRARRARLRRHDVRRLGRRPGRMPVSRRARPATSRRRICSTCCNGSGSRPASSLDLVLAASRFMETKSVTRWRRATPRP